jgi:uncharacterized RDD family membrane protein YckC/ribosomal protein L40E
MDQEEPEIQTSGMLCPHCPGRNPASVSFCTHCGQPTRPENAGCSNCLAELPPDAQFCPECGTPADIPMGSFPRAEPEYMGFWIRAAARLIDTVVIGAMVVLIETFYGPLPPKLTILLFSCIVYPFYYVAPTGLRGQTLGKMALGIMVVNARGKPPGITKAIIREILGKFVSEIALFLGYLWVGRDDKKQGWHDHIASTHVVRAPGRRERPARRR